MATYLYIHRSSIAALEQKIAFLIHQKNRYLPVHPTATTATAAKLTVYEVVAPNASHQISQIITKIRVIKDIIYPETIVVQSVELQGRDLSHQS